LRSWAGSFHPPGPLSSAGPSGCAYDHRLDRHHAHGAAASRIGAGQRVCPPPMNTSSRQSPGNIRAGPTRRIWRSSRRRSPKSSPTMTTSAPQLGRLCLRSLSQPLRAIRQHRPWRMSHLRKSTVASPLLIAARLASPPSNRPPAPWNQCWHWHETVNPPVQSAVQSMRTRGLRR
jgi:hypothetical protein